MLPDRKNKTEKRKQKTRNISCKFSAPTNSIPVCSDSVILAARSLFRTSTAQASSPRGLSPHEVALNALMMQQWQRRE